MANYKQIIPFVKKWEGGLSKDTADSASENVCPTEFNGVAGYHTNKGITYAVWKKHFGSNNDQRFFKMNDEDWGIIYKSGYWDKIRGDYMVSQSIANLTVDMAWGSGPIQAGKILQRAANNIGAKLNIDGLIGNGTLTEINALNETDLFNQLVKQREHFFRSICETSPRNKKFLKGWLNRLENINTTFHPTNK